MGGLARPIHGCGMQRRAQAKGGLSRAGAERPLNPGHVAASLANPTHVSRFRLTMNSHRTTLVLTVLLLVLVSRAAAQVAAPAAAGAAQKDEIVQLSPFEIHDTADPVTYRA